MLLMENNRFHGVRSLNFPKQSDTINGKLNILKRWFYTDADTVKERKFYLERMMACHESKAHVMEVSRYEYYSKWYFSAIRALLSFYSFDGTDYLSLANLLTPAITSEQAQKAVEVLERLGMIRKKENGFFEPCEQIITTGTLNNNRQVQKSNIVNLQKEFLTLAAEAYESFADNQIDMSTITLSISRKTKDLIKEEAAVFRKKVLSLAEKDANPECLYQLNCQLFPLTDPGKNR